MIQVTLLFLARLSAVIYLVLLGFGFVYYIQQEIKKRL